MKLKHKGKCTQRSKAINGKFQSVSNQHVVFIYKRTSF